MTQVDEVVRLVRDVLGGDVVGAYLHGSAVLGGLRPRSDVDVLVVVRRHTTIDERRELVSRLLDVSGGNQRPVELTIVVESDVRPWRYPPRGEFLYGEWLRHEYEGGRVPEPALNPDLAPLIAMALLGNRPLFGPPPADVLDPVPREDLVRAIRAGIPDLLAELDSDTRNIVLTLARIWTTVATGEIRSKDGAADWALARLPLEHRPVLERARAIYLGLEDERWGDLRPRIRPHANHVISEIRRTPAPGE